GIATFTASNFAGEQFILWWNRGADGGGVEGLSFFLNPPYPEPTGKHVKVVNSRADLTDPASPVDAAPIDTLDFEGRWNWEAQATSCTQFPPISPPFFWDRPPGCKENFNSLSRNKQRRSPARAVRVNKNETPGMRV
ncbi:MAG TPA: hypothetical protein VGL82_21030, partial [Bryobacteraceae bacterium]